MMQLDELEHQREADAAALVTASTYAVYRMSADWTEMLQLEGHGFIADTRTRAADG